MGMLSDATTERTLRNKNLIPADALAAVMADARKQQQPLARFIVERKLVTEPQLYTAAASVAGMPFADVRAHAIDRSILELVPASLAAHRRAIAYDTTPTTIRVAIEDPDDVEIIELLQRATGREVIPALTTPTAIADALHLYRADVESAVEELTRLSVQPESLPEEQEPADLHRLAEDVPVVRIVDTLLQHAISLRASDIHIEPTEHGVVVRYRIDGILRPTMTLPKSVAPGLVARIKILANLKIDEHRLPQDGRFKVTTATEHLAVRVAIIPVYDGEKIVLRLLREEGKALTLIDLGIRSEPLGDIAPLAIIERNMRKPHGIIFVTGPTGSGKTTTLYAMMNILNTPGVNIATVEDPIEYRMPEINQSQVNPRIGFTFASGLRALLRQDPNIIMVGEIRDMETADIAVNAALTGHLVLSTLHTNDAATSLTRLQEMNVPTFLVASTINCIVAQRLVRRLCPNCRKQGAVAPKVAEQLAQFGAELTNALVRTGTMKPPPAHGQRKTNRVRVPSLEHLRVWKPQGCTECRNEGYRGRIGIYEVLDVTPNITARIQSRATSDDIRAAAIAEGMTTMFVDGIIKATNGVTSVEEVLRVTRE